MDEEKEVKKMEEKNTRKIAFIAWDKLIKRMYTNPFNGKLGGLNDLFANTGDWIYMQYTGQKDKNGIEVFEGDILEVNTVIGEAFSRAPSHFTNRYIVTFENGKFTFGGYTFDNVSVENIEVIGNIYETPELLSDAEENKKRGEER